MLRMLAVLTIVGCAIPRGLPGQVATAHDHDVPLFIARIDFDCRADTLHGRWTGQQGFLATEIRWGTVSDDTCHADAPTAGTIQRTRIRYPVWQFLDGSTTLIDINEDDVQDLVLSFAGRPYDSKSDTARVLVIFGQSALRFQEVVDLESIDESLRPSPLISVDPRSIGLLRERETRDPTGAGSFEWGSLATGIKPPPSRVEERGPIDAPRWVQLTPNPAVYAATFEIADIPAGEYEVSIVGLDGRSRMEQKVSVDGRRALLRTLDLTAIPSGYYRLRLTGVRGELGTWPVVIQR